MPNVYAQYGHTSDILPEPVAKKKIRRNAANDGWEMVGPDDELATSSDSGAMSAADKTKLDGIEAAATADMTGAEIKAAYEGEPDTNAFTDGEKTKLSGVEDGATADMTGAEIKAAYEAEADTNAFTDAEKTKLAGVEEMADVTDFANVSAALAAADSDIDVNGQKVVNAAAPVAASDLATKAYVDSMVTGGASYQGVWDAATNSPALSSGSGTKGHYYKVSVAGTTDLDGITDWQVGDWAIFNGTAWDKVDNTDQVTSVAGKQGAVTLDTDDVSEGSNLYYTDARWDAKMGAADTDDLGEGSVNKYATEPNVRAALAAAAGPVDVNGQRVHNVGAPSVAEDAANKDYVDSYPTATPSAKGYMSAADKSKLDGLGATFSGKVQTTDATQTTLMTHTPDDNTAVILEVLVVGRRSAGGEAAGFTVAGIFRRTGSVTTQVGSTTVIVHGRDDAAWTVTFTVSGAGINVAVTGKAATVIDWSCRGRISEAP